jgi:hypothetical protein
VVQLDPAPAFNQALYDRVVTYLQTRDVRLFPFTATFDEAKQRAFVQDLRLALSDMTESGSKRGTSAAGFLVTDRRLQRIVEGWADARGDWPENADGFLDEEMEP